MTILRKLASTVKFDLQKLLKYYRFKIERRNSIEASLLKFYKGHQTAFMVEFTKSEARLILFRGHIFGSDKTQVILFSYSDPSCFELLKKAIVNEYPIIPESKT